MKKRISIGTQGFETLRNRDCFYVDKTDFIREWWESEAEVTLITRPRRFGKTLNMDTLNCFFSNHYKDRGELFEGLSIWKNEKYHALQGTYPVIFLSFAGVKANNYTDAKDGVISSIYNAYLVHAKLFDSTSATKGEKNFFQQLDEYVHDTSCQKEMGNDVISRSLLSLCTTLYRYYEKKVIILLDEYDTPMQEAYVNGYWDEFTSFIRSLFNSTFKTNPYLERAVMTGITRVSKESIFSDLNNLKVVTTTSDSFADSFGFTEQEVFAALDDYGLSSQKQVVKQWYDGFIFGNQKDIYNPWSITNFLSEHKLQTYWASTSSNHLVGTLIRTASSFVKEQMEELLHGNEIVVTFDEQIVFNQLDQNENAIWSLLMAAGYLKPEQVEYRGELLKPWYHLKITNLETRSMFADMFAGWFQSSISSYNNFISALIQGNLKQMNIYMNEVALETFSSFDTGKRISPRTQPERFYHGFVLGLLVELREEYQLKSNRESGFGRYDVMLIPHDKEKNAIILEFKVFDKDEESDLNDTAQAALKQIDDRQYDTELLSLGFPKDRIRHYGFAFKGKKVLIR